MTEFLSQNLVLVALFLVSGTMLLFPSISKLFGGGKEIGTLAATRLMNDGHALVLDVRDNSEFAAGRIPKSKNIPLADLEKRIEEIAKFKQKPVILACKTGNRSTAALRVLKQQGFTEIYQLQGGVTAWQQASLPVEK